MTSAEITRRLKGRRIVSVKMNAFGTGRPGWNDYGRDPEITVRWQRDPVRRRGDRGRTVRS